MKMNSNRENTNIELNNFKNEILKMIRNIESKLIEQMNFRNIDITTKINSLHDKLLFLQEDNTTIKNFFTNYKLKIEKINEFESFRKKTESIILTHDIRLNRVLDDLENVRSKYDKMILDNLTVAGFIGPSCQFRNISDYISNNIKESSRIKSEKEKLKLEISNVKVKIDSMYPNLLTLIDASVNRSNNYTNNKQEEFNSLVNGKLEDMNNKIIEMKIRDIQTKNEIEKFEKEFKDNLDILKEIKNKLEKIYEDEKNKKNKENINYSTFNENTRSISEKNLYKYNYNKSESKKERKFSMKKKTIKREKKLEKEKEKQKIDEKEEIKEKETFKKKEEKKEQETISEVNEDKEIELNININKEKDKTVEKINESNLYKDIENIIIGKIEEDNKNEITELCLNNKLINDNLNKYEQEIESIKNNINNINSKIKKLNSALNIQKSKNIIVKMDKVTNREPKNVRKKEFNNFQTNSDNTKISNHTVENFYQSKFLSENESDENTRNIMNEKLYKNIAYNQYNEKKVDKNIETDNNVISKIYDMGSHFLLDKANNTFVSQGYQTPRNLFNKTNYKKYIKKVEIENNEYNESDSSNNLKDLLLSKYNKKHFLKEKDSTNMKSGNQSSMLDKKIIETINFIVKENKYLKRQLKLNDIIDNNKSLSPKDISKISLSFSNNNIFFQNSNNHLRNEYYSSRNMINKNANNNLINDGNEKKLYYKILSSGSNKNKKSVNHFRNKKKLLNFDENTEIKSKQYLSPIVDKLYKDYYYKNNNKEENILNNSNIIPKKIVPVFGRTFYLPIKDEKNNKN